MPRQHTSSTLLATSRHTLLVKSAAISPEPSCGTGTGRARGWCAPERQGTSAWSAAPPFWAMPRPMSPSGCPAARASRRRVWDTFDGVSSKACATRRRAGSCIRSDHALLGARPPSRYDRACAQKEALAGASMSEGMGMALGSLQGTKTVVRDTASSSPNPQGPGRAWCWVVGGGNGKTRPTCRLGSRWAPLHS